MDRAITFDKQIKIKNKNYKYLVLLGGYANPDQGCPPWGTILYQEENFLGDNIGDIVIKYQDKTLDKIPLIFGYSLWFKEFYFDDMEPFYSKPEMKDALLQALHLFKALNKEKHPMLLIETRNINIESISIIYNETKTNRASFSHIYLTNELNKFSLEDNIYDMCDDFFVTHTIKSYEKTKDYVLDNIRKINNDTLTFFDDFKNDFISKKMPVLMFKGDNHAEMLTEIFYQNMVHFLDKIDDDGFMHTSNKDAYLWYYHGFGPYRKFGAFYDKLYSRDAGRSIMSLLLMNECEKAKKVLDVYNKWLMYFPNNNIMFSKNKVQGHFTVMPNEPLIYSTFLTVEAGWKTRFTKEKFGDDYYGLGNLETDGHGLMMMATYTLYKSLNFDKEWLKNNFIYVREAANFLVWQINNPDLTFTESDILYGETEGAMNDYTLYANIPCMIGLKLYSIMAKDNKCDELSSLWYETSKRIEHAIEKRFIKNKKWTNYGFFHDPVITMFYDVSGTSPETFMPSGWFELSNNSYDDDKNNYIKDTYYGPRGLGYDQNMITQNSMILDKEESSKFVEALINLCYAPRLPEPFIVPEGATVDFKNKRIRRQGDIGNLIQQTETIKTIYMLAGIGYSHSDTYYIKPRIFNNWSVEYNNLALPGVFKNNENTIFNGKYEKNNDGYTLSYNFVNKNDNKEIIFRFGPFDKLTNIVKIFKNNTQITQKTISEGDFNFVYVSLDSNEPNIIKVISK